MSGDGLAEAFGLSGDELRAEVRAVLRELLPAVVADAPSRGASAATEVVSLRSDADLDAFARRLAALCEDAGERAAIREGRRRFRLGEGAGPPRGTDGAAGSRGGDVRIERGAVTERRVAQAAADGSRLVLGRRAVLTPLARDKARTLGVVIERER
jgi:hypothetical protein